MNFIKDPGIITATGKEHTVTNPLQKSKGSKTASQPSQTAVAGA